MRIRSAHRANTETFLVHIFGRGLDDERYVIEKYRTLADGQIRPVEAEQPKTKRRGRQQRTIASVSAVEKMRPERDEIIVCTAVKLAANAMRRAGTPAYACPAPSRRSGDHRAAAGASRWMLFGTWVARRSAR